MKKILVLSSLVALASLMGCDPPGTAACKAVAECAEKDPADECTLDEDDQACRDACKAEADALGSCQDSQVGDAECKDKVLTPKDEDACKDQLDDFVKCAGKADECKQ